MSVLDYNIRLLSDIHYAKENTLNINLTSMLWYVKCCFFIVIDELLNRPHPVPGRHSIWIRNDNKS